MPDSSNKRAPSPTKPLPDALAPGSVAGFPLTLNGMTYHVGEQGSGDRVVLMLHGMPDSSGVWRHQIPSLVEAGYRVIAPDLLGYGLSDKPADAARYAGDRLLADMAALLDCLGVEQMDIVGHDWGGFLSWELAQALPERFRRHVVFGTGHPSSFLVQDSPETVRKNWYMYLNSQAAAPALYAANEGRFFKEVIVPSHPELEEVWSRMCDPEAMLGMLNWDRGNNVADMYLAVATSELAQRRCQVPTLGITGADDQYLWEDQMLASERWMDAPWDHASIPGASHWAMLDHPESCSRLLLDWLMHGSAATKQ